MQWTTSTHHAGRQELHVGDRRVFAKGNWTTGWPCWAAHTSQAPSFISLHRGIFTVSKPSLDHGLPTHFPTSSVLQRQWQSDAPSNLPLQVTHQSQRQTWHWGEQSWAHNTQHLKTPQKDSRVYPTWLKEQGYCCHSGHTREGLQKQDDQDFLPKHTHYHVDGHTANPKCFIQEIIWASSAHLLFSPPYCPPIQTVISIHLKRGYKSRLKK